MFLISGAELEDAVRSAAMAVNNAFITEKVCVATDCPTPRVQKATYRRVL